MTGVDGSEVKRGRLGRPAAFALTAYAFAVTMLGTTLPTPLYGLYRAKFGFSELTVTIIFATYAAGVIAALLLFGPLSDEIGRRRVLLGGMALSALSGLTFVLADGLGALLVGRALSGLSAGIFTGTATATLLDLAPDGGRGRATLVEDARQHDRPRSRAAAGGAALPVVRITAAAELLGSAGPARARGRRRVGDARAGLPE
jgi:MFS family permease